VLVVVATWHDCSESVVLRRIVPPGYQSIDAVIPMSLDTADFRCRTSGELPFIC